MTTFTEKRVVEGYKLPSDSPLTGHELAWIEFLRINYDDVLPAPNFDQVVMLRQMDRRNQVDRG
jgi:hypothetical protein